MNGIYNLYIPICGLFVAILCNIVFFSKERAKNKETAIFSRILIYSLLDSIFMVSILYLGVFYPNKIKLIELLNKFDYATYILFSSNFFLYTYYVTSKEDHNKKGKLYNLFFWITTIIDVVLMFLIVFMNVNIHNDGNVMYSDGAALTSTILGCVFYFINIFICLIINFKNAINRKLTPLYVLILFFIVVVVLNQIDKSIVIISAVLAYVNLIMLFTIENPDVKMLTEMTLAKDAADKANRAKSDFLSSMSHEIRTPLNAIVGLSEDNLSYKESMPSEVLENCNDIVNASQTLLEIVGNILDINKIEANKLEIINTKYNFKEELINLCKVTTTRIGEKPIKFSLNIAEDIPYELIGDKVHIKQIINNLLSNACKYTESGYINLNAKCINKEEWCYLIISVQDSGRGIKKELITKLFEKFERLDIEKNTTAEGTGLGLAITKSLVDMMGGKINVQSEFGKGSMFMVTIPQRISVMTNKEEIILEDVKEKINLGRKKILIVDDNTLNIKVARKALKDFNFEIEECYDGIECLEHVKNNTYDLILMDIMMPNMGGEECMKHLKENGVNTPVIALTADAMSGAQEKYISIGFSDYIAKPFSKDQIKERLDKIFK